MTVARKEPGTQVRGPIAAWCLEKPAVGSRGGWAADDQEPSSHRCPLLAVFYGWLSQGAHAQVPKGRPSAWSWQLTSWSGEAKKGACSWLVWPWVPIAFIKWVHLSLSPKCKCFHRTDWSRSVRILKLCCAQVMGETDQKSAIPSSGAHPS